MIKKKNVQLLEKDMKAWRTARVPLTKAPAKGKATTFTANVNADIIVDMRFLPNPFFVPDLKEQDGESMDIKNFVLSSDETKTFLKKHFDMLDFLLPLYIRENKAYLTIAVGCTGGRHRSVVIAREMFEHINSKKLKPGLIHRDIDRDVKSL